MVKWQWHPPRVLEIQGSWPGRSVRGWVKRLMLAANRQCACYQHWAMVTSRFQHSQVAHRRSSNDWVNLSCQSLSVLGKLYCSASKWRHTCTRYPRLKLLGVGLTPGRVASRPIDLWTRPGGRYRSKSEHCLIGESDARATRSQRLWRQKKTLQGQIVHPVVVGKPAMGGKNDFRPVKGQNELDNFGERRPGIQGRLGRWPPCPSVKETDCWW